MSVSGMGMNAAQVLIQGGAPQHVALECGCETLSYEVLRQRVAQAAGVWQGLGLRVGDRVMIMAPDSIDWVVAYLGVIWAGGVAIGVNPRLAMSELAPILSESKSAFVWCETDLAQPLRQLLVELTLPTVLVTGGPGQSDWAMQLVQAVPAPALLQDAEAPALWIGTSGTTGVSKGVVHAHRVALQPHSFGSELLQLSAADRIYASSKLFLPTHLATAYWPA